MADLTQFKELFNPLPGNHYIQVVTYVDETTDALYELMKNVDGELRIAVYTKEDASEIQEKYPDAKVQLINNFSNPFKALPRDNDMVIFKDIFHLHEKQNLLLKLSYTTLANTANIIIMQEKGTMDIQGIIDTLSEYEFRSANYVDVHPGYDLVVAKKMHMWGNGL